ncbi:hypothetical protein AVEN_80309-1 [Araneus ventricosus]|uniref:Elongation of very long chain fatty acids protein n=1 Tax=Araneus ventricosus TaxID=182803 RepID=A0A4Y2IL54_ARAVE|nr:hypothetical protein AVEN_80309-1 [Araneus ventricosus]
MSKKYNDKYYARYGDPRTAQWLLMDNQMYAFILGAAYFVVTKWILPRLMRNRNPCELKKLTIGYNFGMMVLNAWVFYEGFYNKSYPTRICKRCIRMSSPTRHEGEGLIPSVTSTLRKCIPKLLYQGKALIMKGDSQNSFLRSCVFILRANDASSFSHVFLQGDI